MPWLEDLKFPRGYQMGTHILKMEQLSIYLIQMELQQYLNLSMLQVNINGTHFNGGVCLKIIFIYKPLLKK